MKKIAEYRQLLNVDRAVALKELKNVYRNSMKECHPDKFQDNPQALEEAEEKSRMIIEAYHFLVSINPETIDHQRPEFLETIATQAIVDFDYAAARLKVVFASGIAYEFISVPKHVYVKMINADSPGRFAKRHIYQEYPYRKIANQE